MMMKESEEHKALIAPTRQWLKDVVIGFNFCPFARREFESGRVRYRVAESRKTKLLITALLEELHFLDGHDEIETTLLIFSEGLGDFYDYLDFLGLAQLTLEEVGYDGVFQLASFHPEYVFEGEAFDDASNYTNRSPSPMIHLIREASIERAVAAHRDVDGIPERNQILAREKGAEFWRALLMK